MPRQARIDIPGALHHIICRGIERGEIFSDNHDRDDFLSRLAVREVGLTATSLAKYLRISQPAVTQSVERGERLAAERGWQLKDFVERNL